MKIGIMKVGRVNVLRRRARGRVVFSGVYMNSLVCSF